MAQPPLVSVVIPVYNAGEDIERCIASILATGYPGLEIVAVDDASTDDTARRVANLVQAHSGVVRLLRLEQNGGPARARNAGAREARGSFLFFVDSDTQMLPDALERFMERMRQPGVDAVAGMYHWKPINDTLTSHYKALLNYSKFGELGVVDFGTFNGAVGGTTKELFFAVGGYNEDLLWGMDYENEEFGRRFIRDHRLVLDPAVQVRHTFPGFRKMSLLYFSRVVLWMEHFMGERRFEGAVATRETGLGTVAVPAAILLLATSSIWSLARLPALLLLLLYLRSYAVFYRCVLKNKPAFLPAAILLNVWFCTVISAAATWGVVRFFWHSSVAGSDHASMSL